MARQPTEIVCACIGFVLAGRAVVVDALVARQGVGDGFAGRLFGWILEALGPVSGTIPR